jgi:dUTP pyrophosphatase
MVDHSVVNRLWVKCVAEEGAEFPEYQTVGSAGCDLVASADTVVRAGQRTIVGTGLKLEIPLGFEGQVRSRSGLAAKHGVVVLNSPGTIDSDYRGEVKVILFNTGTEDFFVRKGDRVAQLVFSQVYHATFSKAEEVSKTARGGGGFGSTGIS